MSRIKKKLRSLDKKPVRTGTGTSSMQHLQIPRLTIYSIALRSGAKFIRTGDLTGPETDRIAHYFECYANVEKQKIYRNGNTASVHENICAWTRTTFQRERDLENIFQNKDLK